MCWCQTFMELSLFEISQSTHHGFMTRYITWNTIDRVCIVPVNIRFELLAVWVCHFINEFVHWRSSNIRYAIQCGSFISQRPVHVTSSICCVKIHIVLVYVEMLACLSIVLHQADARVVGWCNLCQYLISPRSYRRCDEQGYNGLSWSIYCTKCCTTFIYIFYITFIYMFCITFICMFRTLIHKHTHWISNKFSKGLRYEMFSVNLGLHWWFPCTTYYLK